VSSWVVLPIDLATGRLTEPVMLGPADLGGELPPACTDADDGWLLETEIDTATAIELEGADNYLDSVEFRLRLEPGSACVDGVAARAGRAFEPAETRSNRPPSPGPAASAAPKPMSLVARVQGSGDRWQLWCEKP